MLICSAVLILCWFWHVCNWKVLSGYVKSMKGCECSSEPSGLMVLMADVFRNSICDLFHILKSPCDKRFFYGSNDFLMFIFQCNFWSLETTFYYMGSDMPQVIVFVKCKLQ